MGKQRKFSLYLANGVYQFFSFSFSLPWTVIVLDTGWEGIDNEYNLQFSAEHLRKIVWTLFQQQEQPNQTKTSKQNR